MRAVNAVFLVSLVALGACNPAASPPSDTAISSASAASKQPVPPVLQQDTLTKLRKGMAYADFRKVVVDDGWKPVVDAQCKSNVVGGDYVQRCAANPQQDECRACDELPELGSCSGDGYCGMAFTHGRRTLTVTTYGEIADRFVSGDDSRLEVMGWGFTPENSKR